MAQSMMLLASLEDDDDILLLSCMDVDKESSIYHKLGIDEQLKNNSVHYSDLRKKTYMLCAML